MREGSKLSIANEKKIFLFILALLIAARFLYALMNPVTGDSVFYSLMAEFLAKEGRLPTTELDMVGRIYLLPPFLTVVSAAFFLIGQLFGDGRLFVKLVAPLAGSLAVILAYLLAKELTGNSRTAFFSAILFAALPVSLYMSTVLYIDMLLTFVVTLNIYLLFLAMKKNTTPLWTGTAVSLWLAVLTKFTAIALVAAYAAAAFFMWRKGGRPHRLFGAAASAVAVFVAWNAYQYAVTSTVFLPYTVNFKQTSITDNLFATLDARNLNIFISEFWLGIPFSYDSIPNFFRILFGTYSEALTGMVTVFWALLSIAFAALAIHGFKKSKNLIKAESRMFLNLTIGFFLVMFLAGSAAVTISPFPRYLLPILPIVSIYAAIGFSSLFNGIRSSTPKFFAMLLILLFLAQTGVGVALTSKRVAGWDTCFSMLKEKVPPAAIVFYLNFPDWPIYNAGVRAYGWNLNVPGANHPYDHSLLYQLKTSDFLAYLNSYNVTYLYIDTGQSCGGDAGSFYCSGFAASMKTNPNVHRVSTCNNIITGGWGVLYAIGKNG